MSRRANETPNGRPCRGVSFFRLAGSKGRGAGIALVALLALAAGVVLAVSTTASNARAAGPTPPKVRQIVATFAFPVTTYTEMADPGSGGPLHYAWTNSNSCGTFVGGDSPTATWSHPDSNDPSNPGADFKPGPCPNEPIHPGTITVTVSDANFVCTATDPFGSAAILGTGEFVPCVAKPGTTTTTTTAPTTPPPPPKAKPCKCSALAVRIDPTLFKKPKLRPDQQDFGVGFSWLLKCTKGKGGCTATVTVRPPQILAGAVPVQKGALKLTADTVTVTCAAKCGAVKTGHFGIKMKYAHQLNQIFGRTMAFSLAVTCSGVTKVIKVRVFVDQHGRFTPAP